MQLSLAQVQEVIGARPLGRIPAACATGWSIDSRTAVTGDLFFALKGERFDGHAFVRSVLQRGAAAAVVSEPVSGGPLLEVADTLAALQTLAHWAREQWGRPVVAVTGSAGKTSTKDIIAEFLSVRLRVGKTMGNFNNHIGLPLTLLRVPDNAEAAVVELGMNHAGEIRELAAIAKPQYGVVTNVGFAHVENFASIEGVAAAKRELIEALPASGVAVLNADDELVSGFRKAHSGRTISYGFAQDADVRATELELLPDGAAFTANGVRFHSQLTGRHSVSNILAGLAVASLFEIEPVELVDTVARLKPAKMRGERSRRAGVTILNDSYNSNPEAARNMLDVLLGEPGKRRIAVLGEMLELGQMSEMLHRELGKYAARGGVDLLVGIGGAARCMIEEGEKAGLSDGRALFFDEPDSAGAFLQKFVEPGDAILFKGSRGTQVERTLAKVEDALARIET